MTSNTEAEQAKAKAVSALASVVVDLGFTAAFSWMGGIAFGKGFGVSVPFMAGWLLSLMGLWGSQVVTGQLAGVWHRKRVEADISLLAASMAAQDAIEERKNAEAFLAMDKRIKDMSSKVDGGYL